MNPPREDLYDRVNRMMAELLPYVLTQEKLIEQLKQNHDCYSDGVAFGTWRTMKDIADIIDRNLSPKKETEEK